MFGRGQVLAPSRSQVPLEPPTLMEFLNSSSDFTLFRRYALVRCLFTQLLSSRGCCFPACFSAFVRPQMYNLSKELLDNEFTLLLPTDDAVRQHLSRTNSSLLVGASDWSNNAEPGSDASALRNVRCVIGANVLGLFQ